MIHEGQLLRNLVKKLKAENGMSRNDVAQKIGISPEHLSTIYNRESLTAEIKSRAIEGLGLPPDFFKGQESAPSPADQKAQEVERLRQEVKEKIETINQWILKYANLLEEYNKHLKESKKE